MRDVEFLEDCNQVVDIVAAGNRISFLSNDQHTRRDSQLVSKPQKISQATERECVIPALTRQERSTKERFVSPLKNECGIDHELAFEIHHSR